jgi:hypothetical protein
MISHLILAGAMLVTPEAPDSSFIQGRQWVLEQPQRQIRLESGNVCSSNCGKGSTSNVIGPNLPNQMKSFSSHLPIAPNTKMAPPEYCSVLSLSFETAATKETLRGRYCVLLIFMKNVI